MRSISSRLRREVNLAMLGRAKRDPGSEGVQCSYLQGVPLRVASTFFAAASLLLVLDTQALPAPHVPAAKVAVGLPTGEQAILLVRPGPPRLLTDHYAPLSLRPEREYREFQKRFEGDEEFALLGPGPTGLSGKALFDSTLVFGKGVTLAVDGD